MIFSTYQFMFIFLPIVFAGYYILNGFKFKKLSKIWLVLASLYFYAQGSPSFFPIFFISITGNYIVGTTLSKMEGKTLEKKILFGLGILANVILLGYYKYTNFFIANFNLVTGQAYPYLEIVLPIGISFFTFQLIAFLVDSYRGETKEYDVINYLLFITFFPQLIVGPIIHHAEVVPQFENEENQKLNLDNLAKGIFLFAIGCAKKICIADVLTSDAQAFFESIANTNAALQMFPTWFHAIEYTISYYFDLSGYADMAIGLGLMFNIIIPRNFNSPYKARNFQDYWRRWHMTLSKFLSAYIFRSVYKKDSKFRNYYIATMVTFFVSGFWHGAGWTFIAWGILNGIFVCIAAWMDKHNKKFPAVLAYSLTAIGVVLTRVLFVSEGFSEAIAVYKGMVNFTGFNEIGTFLIARIYEALILILGMGICFFAPNSNEMADKFKPTYKNMILIGILFALAITQMNKVVQFLYFQF